MKENRVSNSFTDWISDHVRTWESDIRSSLYLTYLLTCFIVTNRRRTLFTMSLVETLRLSKDVGRTFLSNTDYNWSDSIFTRARFLSQTGCLHRWEVEWLRRHVFQHQAYRLRRRTEVLPDDRPLPTLQVMASRSEKVLRVYGRVSGRIAPLDARGQLRDHTGGTG